MENNFRGYDISILEVMLADQNEKFMQGLERGTSWGQLSRIRKNICELNDRIAELKRGSSGNHGSSGERNDRPNSFGP